MYLYGKILDTFIFNKYFYTNNEFIYRDTIINNKINSEYYYRYAQALKATKNYRKADEILAQFFQKNGTDLRAKLANSQKDYLYQIQKNYRK